MTSGYLIETGLPDRGHQLATATAIAMVGATGPRAIRLKKFMPGGLIASVGMIAVCP